jgi:hypothetical protein
MSVQWKVTTIVDLTEEPLALAARVGIRAGGSSERVIPIAKVLKAVNCRP